MESIHIVQGVLEEVEIGEEDDTVMRTGATRA